MNNYVVSIRLTDGSRKTMTVRATTANTCGNNLTEEERKKWSDFWELIYGFRPEEE